MGFSVVLVLVGLACAGLCFYFFSKRSEGFGVLFGITATLLIAFPTVGNFVIYRVTVINIAEIEKLQEQENLLGQKILEVEPVLNNVFRVQYPEYEKDLYSQFNGANWMAQMVGFGLPDTKMADGVLAYAAQYRELKDDYYDKSMEIARVKAEVRANLRYAMTMSVFMPISLDDPMIQVKSVTSVVEK